MDLLEKYKRMGFNPHQLQQIELGYKNNLTSSKIDIYARLEFDHLQMEELRLACQDGFDYEQLLSIAHADLDHLAMNHMRIKIRNSLKVDEQKSAELTKMRLKNSIFFSLLGIVLVILTVFVFIAKDEIEFYFQGIELTLTTNTVTLNYGDPFVAMNYIKSYTEQDDVELILPDVYTNILGEQKVIYKIKNRRKVLSRYIKLIIVDSKAPTIVLKEKEVSIIKGENTFDCKAYIKEAIDNVSGDVSDKVECSNDIDYSKQKQNVNYIVIDDYGNTTEESLELIIKEKPKTDSNNNTNTVKNKNNYTAPVEQPVQQPTQQQPAQPSGGNVQVYDTGWMVETIESIDSSGNAIVKWE